MITMTETEAELISILLTDDTLTSEDKMEGLIVILSLATDPEIRENPEGVAFTLLNNIDPDKPSLTPLELEELEEALMNGDDISSILENATDPNITAIASTLGTILNNVNPNNPNSDMAKVNTLQKAADNADLAIQSAAALKEEYDGYEEQRVIDEELLEKIWEESIIEPVTEGEISVTTGYDTGIIGNRKELTSIERRTRRDVLVGNLIAIIESIKDTKEIYLPNGIRDLDTRNTRVWRYLNDVEMILIEIKSFNMANVILRSSFKIPIAQNKLIELINFYDDWTEWNIDIYNNLVDTEQDLSNLYDLMEKYKTELALL
jgi:hypothetical protein